MKPVSSWGRLSAHPHEVVDLGWPGQIPHQLRQHPLPGIAIGMARSYGDACLNPNGVLWNSLRLDHLIAFDDRTGVLTCEAGVTLREIQHLAVPRGWILPVTPGTQLVTVGGAIANDVHGKNHHAQGTFGAHLLSLRLVRTDGSTIDCSRDQNPEWLRATIGGLGMTGVIVEASIQLRNIPGPELMTETLPFFSLDEFFQLSSESERDWEHTVSWIDCMNSAGQRGLFSRANFAQTNSAIRPPHQKPLKVPAPPFSVVNSATLRPFNATYFNLKRLAPRKGIAHYERFFYPLDNIENWNRMYGPEGFFQYQCAIPRQHEYAATHEMLKQIARSGEGSFLAVLKTFGDNRAAGLLSFPMPGTTLALDFPNRGKQTLDLFTRLDTIVAEAGGRIYAAKDARMPRKLFESGYPNLAEFMKFRDPGISSSLSRRLMGS